MTNKSDNQSQSQGQPKPETTVPPRQNDPHLGATEQKDGKPSGETRHK
jgi:hypothetical protein